MAGVVAFESIRTAERLVMLAPFGLAASLAPSSGITHDDANGFCGL